MQEMVANEVNDRMGRAVGELKDKYEKGGKGYDAASDAQVRVKARRQPPDSEGRGGEGRVLLKTSLQLSVASVDGRTQLKQIESARHARNTLETRSQVCVARMHVDRSIDGFCLYVFCREKCSRVSPPGPRELARLL